METKEISRLMKVLIVADRKLLRDGLANMFHTFKKDYQLPSLPGPETLLRMLRFKPNLKVLSPSIYNEITCIPEMLEAGACGYVLKSVHTIQLLSTINTVLAGKKYFWNEIALTLIASLKEANSKNDPQYNISPGQLEILIFIAQEMNNRRTADTHRQNFTIY